MALAKPKPLYEKLGGRRFVLTCMTGIVCSGLLVDKDLTSEDFRWIIMATVAAYISGNTYEATKAPNLEKTK